MTPTVSVVIVNFNAGPLLARCLSSLEQQRWRDFEVIVVDNASRDDSLPAAARLPWVQIIRSKTNLGFAAGQNLGMQAARGRYLMPLNFDIQLLPDTIWHMVCAMERYPRVGTVSGKLLRMSLDGQKSSEIDNAGLLLSRRRMPKHRGGGEHDHGQYDQQALVFGAMGALALYRREMLDEIAIDGKYFDESFFTWYEDIDLDWRGRLQGWDCLYVPEAVAYHVGDPQKNHLTAFAARHTIRNRWQMILADDCAHCMLRDARHLLVEELALLRHVIRHRRLGAYLLALGDLIVRLPEVLAKRKRVRSKAIRPCLPDYPLSIPE
jgi:GT2 family glycosyltransferase